MPELGEKWTNARRKEVIWKECPRCHQQLWLASKYDICYRCTNTPGQISYNDRGDAYMKLEESSPFYPMTLKQFGFFGKGWVRVSRLAVAQHLGRPLTEEEVVYHKSSDTHDDALSNLFLKKRATPQDGARKVEERREEQLERSQEAYEAGYADGYKAGRNSIIVSA